MNGALSFLLSSYIYRLRSAGSQLSAPPQQTTFNAAHVACTTTVWCRFLYCNIDAARRREPASGPTLMRQLMPARAVDETGVELAVDRRDCDAVQQRSVDNHSADLTGKAQRRIIGRYERPVAIGNAPTPDRYNSGRRPLTQRQNNTTAKERKRESMRDAGV